MATGRVAAVFFEGDELIGWCRSAQAFTDTNHAQRIARGWLHGFGPDQVMTEDRHSLARKGPQSQMITETVANAFADAECLDIRVRRHQTHENKYDEAKTLAERFPAAQSILPQRPPIWLPEPRNMSYFEALSLVATVLNDRT